jgi:hypothetical protein
MNVRNLAFVTLISLTLFDSTNAIAQTSTAAKLNNSVISNFCQGTPRIYIDVLEKLSKRLLVNPNTINLQRVTIFRDGGGVFFCTATFYSPSGAFDCRVEFRENKIISSACENDFTSYTTSLYANAQPPITTEPVPESMFTPSGALKKR